MGLTGRESLIYASKLKNSLVENNIDHSKNASTLMNDLMISDTANTLVGNCSGGEQKRLAIGMELASLIKPNLICIDEPTSGLDSNAADLVISLNG
jgi:ABC-type multidrug transport system ATPase subunit